MMRLNRGGKQPQGTSPFAAQAAVGSKGLAWASQLLARAWPLCVGAARASVEASPVGSGWLAVGGQVGCQGTGDTVGCFLREDDTRAASPAPCSERMCAGEALQLSVCPCEPTMGVRCSRGQGPTVRDPSCVARASLAARVPPLHSSGQSQAQE